MAKRKHRAKPKTTARRKPPAADRLRRALTEHDEALRFQAAIADILTALSRSRESPQPVFDAIVRNVRSLFDTRYAVIFLIKGDQLELAAWHGDAKFSAPGSEAAQRFVKSFPQPVDWTTFTGQAMKAGEVRQLVPIVGNPQASPRAVQLARTFGYNSMVTAPLVIDGRVVGTIGTNHSEAKRYSERELASLKAFADQAVIAIENARLFNETKEALDQQKASADILRVIAASPGDIQPVLEAMAETAARLCRANDVIIRRLDGDQLRLAAHFGSLPITVQSHRCTRETVGGRAVLDRRTVHVEDMLSSQSRDEFPDAPAVRQPGPVAFHTVLAVPLLRHDGAVGVIVLRRLETQLFSDQQVMLLESFADQAVIAIENARLFNETKEALDRQTATSEILQVIGRSMSDTQPVFDAIVGNCGRLFADSRVSLWLIDDGRLFCRASSGFIGAPMPVDRESAMGACVLEQQIIHLPDLMAAAERYPRIRQLGLKHDYRSGVYAPLLRAGAAIGGISVLRRGAGAFAEKDVALLSTFASQAVIAIENVRLFKELEARNSDLSESLEQQTATADILRVISGSLADSQPVFERILLSCERLFGGNELTVFLLGDDGLLHVGAARGPMSEQVKALFPVPLAGTATELAIRERRAVTYANALDDPDVPAGLRGIARRLGAPYSLAMAPMLWEERGIGSILVARPWLKAFSEKELALLRTFADQAVIAIQNARLFREIQEKSAQLEVANKHKSEFLANMSHELRTPLNAVIGFSEVLMDQMFGEVNEKQADYLKDIHESGRHLLSLINDILDLSKIEAGRMELELSSFDLPAAIGNAMTLVRERAQRHGIRLAQELDPRLGEFQGDERKVKQILLNLLSNAVKFTPDGGSVEVAVRLDTASVEIAVRDTGIGIAPEDQSALFEEFRQVGRDSGRKAEGTGLGLALTRKFVELHGGAIRVQSAPGSGSTFTVLLPLRP